MNTSTPSYPNDMRSSNGAAYDSDEIDLRELLYTLLDHKITIALITAVALALGVAYALLATPIYESNILVQVEDAQKGLGNNLISEASSLFDVKTDAAAEMEILKSRMIAEYPVDKLGLNITAEPHYFPLIGKGIARLNTGLSQPGLWGWGGFVWGAEAIEVAQFSLPPSRIGRNFSLQALGQQRFALTDPLSGQRFTGRVGQKLPLVFDGKAGFSILVRRLDAQNGAAFDVAASSRLAEIAQLQQALAIKEQGKGSGVISVSMKGASPQRLADILNAVAEMYLRQNIERKSAEAENSLVFLNKQLPVLKQELEAAESRYNQYRNQRGVVDLGEEGKALLDQASSASTRLAELRQRQQALAARYLPDHPEMQAIAGMLAQAQAEANRVNAQIKGLPLVEQDALRLSRDMKVSTELYANLLQTTQQLRLVKAGKVGTVRLIDPAVVPERPVAPKKSLVVLLATLLGAMAGVALVLVRKAMRGAVESIEEIEQLSSLPVFTSVPHSLAQVAISQDLQKQKKANLLAHTAKNDMAVESLRSLYTALQFASLGARNNILLITGATPGVGKSFVAANYAAVMAAAGQRVLLIDGDIRKGYLHKYFAQAQQKGLSELLAGQISWAEAVHKAVLPGLDFLSCGVYPPNPTELLRRPQLEQLLQSLAAQYDCVLIDAAPVLPVTDPLILAGHTGTCLVIAREGQSTREEIGEVLRRSQQAGAAITGFVLNDVQQNKSRYRYGYSYGYSYNYGGEALAPQALPAWRKLLRKVLK